MFQKRHVSQHIQKSGINHNSQLLQVYRFISLLVLTRDSKTIRIINAPIGMELRRSKTNSFSFIFVLFLSIILYLKTHDPIWDNISTNS